MKAPDPPPPDPLAVQADNQARQEQLNALQTRSRGDSASLMARYGVLALAGMSQPPPAASPAPGAFAVKV